MAIQKCSHENPKVHRVVPKKHQKYWKFELRFEFSNKLINRGMFTNCEGKESAVYLPVEREN